MQNILKIQSLCKVYGKGSNQTNALNGISLNVMKGEFVGVMGSSGSGKSTLLNCISTVIRPTSGSILLKDEEIQSLKGEKLTQYRGSKIGYIFQNFELIDNLTAKENILLSLYLHKFSEKDAKERLEKLADYFEINDIMNKFPSQMSGGQKQRVATVRALILNPEIVLADEPTGALDSKNAKILMEKLEIINTSDDATILMVTHDSNAASYCKRILFIQDGKIFHELRRDIPNETRQDFYQRILNVMATLSGGSANVL